MGVITPRQLCDKSVTPLDRPAPSQTCHTTVARLSLFVLRCHPGRPTVLAMTTDRRRDRGALGERIAAEHLEPRGAPPRPRPRRRVVRGPCRNPTTRGGLRSPPPPPPPAPVFLGRKNPVS